MFYSKNLPTWERLMRFAACLGLFACAYAFWGKPASYVFATIGVITLLTSLVGFCPACWMAGRRLRARVSAP